MKKYILIFTMVVLLMLAGGCTQPAPQPTVQLTVQPTATPVPVLVLTATPEAIVTSSAVLTTGNGYPAIPNAVSDNTIHISKKGFDPVRITVKKGTTVRWVNEDSTTDPALYNPTHRITLANIKNSPLLSPGQGWSWIFTDTGTFDYSDMIHDVAKGTVVVE